MVLKRILAMVLCIAMVLGTMSVSVFAEAYPTATATEIYENGLTYAVKFEGNEQLDAYNLWYLDVELTSNKDITLDVNDSSADGYLSVNVPSIGWRNLPAGSPWGTINVDPINLTANTPFKVMDYFYADYGFGGKHKYPDLFNESIGLAGAGYGVYLTPAFLAENPDFEMTLALKIYNPTTGSSESITLASYTAPAPKYVVELYRASAMARSSELLYVDSYESLEAALADAQDGDTIKVVKDFEIGSQVTVDKAITLDLNSYTISGALATGSSTNHIYALSNNSELTVMDSVGGGSIDSRGVYNYGTLTLESGAINSIDGNGGYAVNNKEGSTFIMNGGVVAATYEDDYQSSSGGYDATPLNVPAGATATLNGGKITNVCDFTFAVSAAGTLNIPADSTIEIEGAHGAIAVTGGKTTIDAGTFTIPADEYARTDNVIYVSGGAIEINGGTFVGDGDAASGGSCICDTVGTAVVNGGSFEGSSGGDVWGTTGTTINGGTFENLIETKHVTVGATIVNDGKTYVMTDAGLEEKPAVVNVAKVGDVLYTDLQEAINAANGGTVTLLSDVNYTTVYANNKTHWNGDLNYELSVGGNVTLDLNGYTIKTTGGSSHSYYALICVRSGSLTVVDSSDSKSGAIICSAETVAERAYTIYNNGALILNGGTVSNTIGNYAIESVTTGTTSLEINDGATVTSTGIAVRVCSQGSAGTQTVTINGGDISGTYAMWVPLKNGGNDVTNLTINGGTFTGSSNAILFNTYTNGDVTTDSVKITDGEFNGDVLIGAQYSNDANNNALSAALAGTVISGGTFSNDVSDYVADGFEVKENADGTFGITDAVVQLPDYVVFPAGMEASNYVALFGSNTVTDGTNYYATLQAAVEAVCGKAGAVLYCKPGADVGNLQHAPVTATLTVYGNGAYVSGGAERDFDIGNTDPSGGKDITADMTLTVKHLDGCGAWGAKATSHTVNLVFENCDNMGKVFLTGTTGVLNITMTDSSFDGIIKEAVYSNADGAVTLTNVAFENLNKAINLNHKASGTMTVTLDGCSFTNCGNDVSADQIPVRILSSVDGGKSVATVKNCSFTGTPAGGADILFDYGVGTTEATVSSTAASIVVEKENNVGETTEVKADEEYSFTNVVAAVVAKIGDATFATFDEALAAASAMTGDVVVELYDKVTLNKALSGSYSTIKFVGKADAAEIYLDVQGYITATGKKVTFEDLKLSKVAGGYIANAGFMNLAFGIFDVTEVTYKNCTFLNGAYASSGDVTFTGCTFYRSHDRYGLWAYGDVDAVVDNCTFADIRGIKMYAEGFEKTVNLTVKNTDFTAADNKPAIVLTCGESVTLENNTYSSKGVFELDLDGVPNGTPVTSDVPVTCINDNGACGVLVDGKIYTTVAQAAEVATSGSQVLLLHDSAETVEFVEGVVLDKNNFAAEGVTVKVAAVAKIGDVEYRTLAEAVAAAVDDDTVTVITDISDEAVSVTKNITITSDASNKATLNNVSLTMSGTTVELTVSNLKFTGSSYINANNGAALTVTNCEADVNPTKITGRAAFIVTGTSELTHGLKLVVTDNTILSAQSSTDVYSAAIFGWRYLADGTTIADNIFGADADTKRYTFIAVKSMNAMDGAKFTLENNTIYGTSTKYVLLAFDLYQNCSRANTYTVISKNNTINATVGTSYPVIAFNISGNTGFADSTNLILLDNGTTINGAALTLADIDAADAGSDYDKFYGVDVVTDESGKIISGTFGATPLDEYIAEGYKYKVNDDGTFTVIEDIPVAKIGDVKYATLEDAIAAVQAGETITLLDNVAYVNVVSESNAATAINVPAGKKFTLDLNGYILSGESNLEKNFSFITICSGADVTIVDSSDAKTGTITYKSTRETPNENHEGHTIKNKGILTLNSGKIENSTPLASNGYEMCVTTAIDNGASTGAIASFIMNGGEVVSNTYFAIRSNVYAATTSTERTPLTVINGGTVHGLHFCDWGSKDLDYEVAIGDDAVVKCGNYPDYTAQSIRVVIGATATTKVALEISENAQIEGESVVKGVAIKNGNKYYVKSMLQAAIDEAQSGDTLVLLNNVIGDVTVAADDNITIDLAGFDIVGTMNGITNNGTLTINDSVGTGNVYTTDVAAQARPAIYNTGNITINGGWFGDSNNDTTDRNGINRGNAIKNAGTAVINGGYFTNVSNQYIGSDAFAYAINTLTGGTTTINDATVYGDVNGLIYSDGTTIVEDGSFTLGRPNEENNLWYLAYGNVEIKGGTWTRAFKVPSWNTNNPTLYGDVVVSGGTFSVEIPEANIADGLELVENGDGTYGIAVKAPVVAKIGNAEYETLADAIAAAQDNDVVEILEGELDLGSASYTIDKAITLKGAGKDTTKLIFDSATSAFVIASSNVTFEDMTITQGTQSNSFHISISKGAWDAPAIQYSAVTIKNIDFVGGNYALCLIGEDVVVDSCSFTGQSSHNILVYSLKGNSEITNNTFNASTKSNKSAILWEGGADNATDTSNFVAGGTLTIDGNTANSKGVFFQFTNWKLVKDMNVSITNNKIDAFTNKAIALYDMDGAVTAAGNEFTSFVVNDNVFTNVPSGRTIIKEYTGTVEVDASKNYLGSEEPDYEALLVGEKVTVENYYTDEAKTNLVPVMTPVAKIGDVEYETLADALAAAQAGDTITLLVPVVVGAGEELNIDLAGKIISYTSDVAGEDMITNNGTLTINDSVGGGKITYCNTDTTGSNVTVSTITNGPGGLLTVNGGTIENTSSDAKAWQNNGIFPFAIDNVTNGNLGTAKTVINNGLIKSNYRSIRLFANSTSDRNTVNINGGEMIGQVWLQAPSALSQKVSLVINGGKFSPVGRDGSSVYVTTMNATTPTFRVLDGYFTTKIGTDNATLAANYGIAGGTFTEAAMQNTPADLIRSGYEFNVKEDGTYGVDTIKVISVTDAQGNVTKYNTVDAAARALNDGDTITLLKDVTKGISLDGKSVTLDLNGKTMTQSGAPIFVENGSNLTVMDSVGGGKITSTGDVFTVENSTLTVKSGEFESTSGSGISASYATVTMEGGKLIAADNGISMIVNSESAPNTLTITDGEIVSGSYAIATNGTYDNSIITISGGIITGTEGGIYHSAEGKLIIDGGKISGNTGIKALAGAIDISDDVEIIGTNAALDVYYQGPESGYGEIEMSVTGGTLTGAVTSSAADGLEAKDNFISGGTFSMDVSDFCAEGYVAKENTQGTFGVVEAPVVKIGDITYTTLAEALAVAVDGDVITLLDDVELSTTTNIAKSVTIDGNGYKIGQAADFSSNGANAMLDIMGGGTVTFNNVTFDGIKDVAVMRSVSADVVMDNCIVTNCTQTVSQGLLRLACGNATITNSQFVNNDCTMVVSFGYDAANDSDVLTIDGCLFDGNTCGETAVVYFADGDYGTVTNTKFVNNNVSSAGNAATLYMGWGSGFEVSGCTFEGNTVTTTHATTKRFASAIFCDGCTVNENVFKNNTAIRNGEAVSTTVAVAAYYGEANVGRNYWNDGSEPVLGEDYTVEYTRNPVENRSYYASVDANGTPTNLVITKKAAEVNGTPYETFDGALAAANAGDTVVICEDMVVSDEIVIAADKTIALDLNGYTISRVQTETATANSQLIKNLGNLTIKDSSAEQTGTLSYTYAGEHVPYSVSTISNTLATLTVESGTIENNTLAENTGANGAYAYAIDSLTNGNGGDAIVTIAGGTIKSNYMAIRQFVNSTTNNNTLVVTGGEIVGEKRAINVQGSNDTTKVSNTAVLDISGGVVKAVSESGYSVCALTSSENMSLNGGTFIGTIYSDAMGIITGGIFDRIPYEGYVAEGLKVRVYEDGTYGIVDASWIDPSLFDAVQIGDFDDMNVVLGTTEADVKALLPATVIVMDETGLKQEEVPVKTWTCIAYNANVAGEYVFEGELDADAARRATIPADMKAQVTVIVNKLTDSIVANASTNNVGLLLKRNDAGTIVEQSAEDVALAVAAALGNKVTLQGGAFTEEFELPDSAFVASNGVKVAGDTATVTITVPADVDSKYFTLSEVLTINVTVEVAEAVLRVVPNTSKAKTGETITLDIYVDCEADSIYLDSASWTIPFDTDVFEYVDGTLYSVFGSNSTSVRNGNIYMMALGHKSVNAAEPVQTIELKAIKDVNVAENFEFDFDVLDSELSGEDGIPYKLAHQPAAVTIVPSFIATKIVAPDAVNFEFNTTEQEVLAGLPTQITVTNEDGTKKDKVDVVEWKLIPEGTEFNSETPGIQYIYEAELDDSNATYAVLSDDLKDTKVQIEVNITKFANDITIDAGIDGSAMGIDGDVVYIRPKYAFGDSWQTPEEVAKAVYEKLGGKISLSKDGYEEKLSIEEEWIEAADGVSGLGSKSAVTITIPAGTQGVNFEFFEDTIINLTAIVKMLGDVNMDGVINGKDAFAIQKYILYGVERVLPNWDQNEADVNVDEKINGKDAIAIQRYVLYGILY